MPRVIALLLSLAFTLPVHAEGFITRLLNKPVPGGVAVMSLGNGATPPHVRYQDKPALVIREDDQRWIAILGIPLTVKPGQQQVQVDGRPRSFQVQPREYRAQHITAILLFAECF